ncbi:hypothetical protein O6H91_09G090200 [Diphasiastrum complanatum]|uniref:Uncharacterized protein n=1 Tax=Diphasiastrum complanatum TaxID=34168 RepID=A0ACC2CRY9_DIPCM|nr:hypothetical protein O6H91_09G090200 [Diphasiastrum complanatum]
MSRKDRRSTATTVMDEMDNHLRDGRDGRPFAGWMGWMGSFAGWMRLDPGCASSGLAPGRHAWDWHRDATMDGEKVRIALDKDGKSLRDFISLCPSRFRTIS